MTVLCYGSAVTVPSRFKRGEGFVCSRWVEKSPEHLKREEDEFRLVLEQEKPWWRPFSRYVTDEEAGKLREICVALHRGDLLAILFRKFAVPAATDMEKLFTAASQPALIGVHGDSMSGTGQLLFLDFQALQEMLAVGAESPGFISHARSALSEAREALRQPFDGRSNRQQLIDGIDALEIMKAVSQEPVAKLLPEISTV